MPPPTTQRSTSRSSTVSAPGFTDAPGFAGSASSFTIGPKPSRAASGKDAAPSADSETPRRKSRLLKLATWFLMPQVYHIAPPSGTPKGYALPLSVR